MIRKGADSNSINDKIRGVFIRKWIVTVTVAIVVAFPMTVVARELCIDDICIGDGVSSLLDQSWINIDGTTSGYADLDNQKRIFPNMPIDHLESVHRNLIKGVFDKQLLGTLEKKPLVCEFTTFVGEIADNGDDRKVTVMIAPDVNDTWRVINIRKRYLDASTERIEKKYVEQVREVYGEWIPPEYEPNPGDQNAVDWNYKTKGFVLELNHPMMAVVERDAPRESSLIQLVKEGWLPGFEEFREVIINQYYHRRLHPERKACEPDDVKL